MTEYTIKSETARTGAAAATDFIPIYDSNGTIGTITPALLTAGAPSIVATTAGAVAITLSAASYAGRTLVLLNTAPIAVTLPTATGSGAVYRIFIGAAATTTSSTIKVGNATDVMRGILVASTTSSVGLAWVATATDDTISINGSTKGGLVGDVFEIRDIAAGIFSAQGVIATTGAAATPFVSAV